MYFIRLIVKRRPVLLHTFPLHACILYLTMAKRTTETCRREIMIKARLVFGCCFCMDWVAIE
jgi:hypothetical protein